MMMRHTIRLGIVFLAILLLMLSSCNLIQAVSQQENDPESETAEQAEGDEQPVGGDQPAEDAESSDDALVGCFDVKAYTLSVDHTLTINEAETSLTHILHHGGIVLETNYETDEADCSLSTMAPVTLPYEYLGVVGPCEVDAQGSVIFSAEGYCQDGIVYLTITEDWQKASGTMTCDGEVVSFPIAAYTAVHSGESGNGEEFLITMDDSGYTVMREFQGGEGYHSWTLAYDVELVPLAPEED